MQKVNDSPLKKCPHCGKSQLQRLMSAPVFRLKGGGWYETDFKGDQDNKKNLADRPEAQAPKEEKKEAAADAKSQGRRDARATAKPAGKDRGQAGGEGGARDGRRRPERSRQDAVPALTRSAPNKCGSAQARRPRRRVQVPAAKSTAQAGAALAD